MTPWNDLPQAVYETNVEGQYQDHWTCGNTRNIAPGDRLFLMRLSVPPKGLIGSGIVISAPFEGLHWLPDQAAQGIKVYRVNGIFDVLCESPLLNEHALKTGKLSEFNWFPQGSGTRIPDEIARELEVQWSKVTETTYIPLTSAEIAELKEGKRRQVLVNQYERNPEAREQCIAYYKACCQVCGLIFDDHYGGIGKGFIHVHHLIPVSERGQEYNVDPIKDMRPVCPNCHAMLHKNVPPYTIEKLKSLMSAYSKRH